MNGAAAGTLTVAEARALITRRLQGAGVASPEAEAVTLLEAVTGLGRAALLTLAERPLAASERLRLLRALRRRAAREPLQHILGTAPFYGFELAVGPEVLVPRPETERLVELVLDAIRGVRQPAVLDVGCGSGAIALAVARERPDARVLASDVSPEAVQMARANVARLRSAVEVRRSDLLADADVAAFAASAHALIANLPYLPASDLETLQPEARADPALALFAGDDGLDVVRRLLRQAARLLPGAALLALELDPRNVRAAAALLRGWSDVTLECDMAGRERFLLARR